MSVLILVLIAFPGGLVTSLLARESADVGRKRRLDIKNMDFEVPVLQELAHDVPHTALRIG